MHNVHPTITADPRELKAVDIVADAGQWLRVRDNHSGELAYGIPSRCFPGRYFLVTAEQCDCPDFQYHGLSPMRIGQGGLHQPCKHILAVRMHEDLPELANESAAPFPIARRVSEDEIAFERRESTLLHFKGPADYSTTACLKPLRRLSHTSSEAAVTCTPCRQVLATRAQTAREVESGAFWKRFL